MQAHLLFITPIHDVTCIFFVCFHLSDQTLHSRSLKLFQKCSIFIQAISDVIDLSKVLKYQFFATHVFVSKKLHKMFVVGEFINSPVQNLNATSNNMHLERALDTGPYFWKGCPKAQFFKSYSKVKNPKVGSFLRAQEDLEGLRIQKFSILNANLWSIYSKRFEFMVYTCFCAF